MTRISAYPKDLTEPSKLLAPSPCLLIKKVRHLLEEVSVLKVHKATIMLSGATVVLNLILDPRVTNILLGLSLG